MPQKLEIAPNTVFDQWTVIGRSKDPRPGGAAWPVRRLAACGAVLQVRLPLNGKDTQNSL